MNKLPEKLFIHKDLKVGEMIRAMTTPFKNSVEYVCKDVAEKQAKDFAIYYEEHKDDVHGWHKNGEFIPQSTIDELFTEFINSRKK